MKIYTTQVIKEQVLTDDFKVVLAPIKSYSKDGHAYLDITATAGSQFAPSWDLLRAFKAGKVSKHEYTDEYHALMSKNCKEDRPAWEWLQSRKSIVLACYCNPGAFCHRYIFADILEKCFMVDRIGELPQQNVKNWIEAMQATETKADEAEQLREYTNLFLKDPDHNTPLRSKERYSHFEKKPFFSDNWIFQGTDNDPDTTISDDFLRVDGVNTWSGIPEKQINRETARKLKNTVPLKYGDIGAVAISKKFQEGRHLVSVKISNDPDIIDSDILKKNEIKTKYDKLYRKDILSFKRTINKPISQKVAQLDRIIYEDCKPTPEGIKIMQLTASHEVMIPSHLQVDKIATYANISHRHAAFVSKCYQELDFDFNAVKRVNKAIRNRKTAQPWDIDIFNGKSLLDLVFDLKHIDILAELEDANDPQYDDWCHYSDGIFDFKIIDDLAASAPAGLSEIEFIPFDDTKTNYIESDLDSYTGNNKVNLFTYWNVSKIKTPDELKGAKTARTFKKMRNAILDNNLSAKALKKFKKITRKFTPAQRKEIHAAIRARAARRIEASKPDAIDSAGNFLDNRHMFAEA